MKKFILCMLIFAMKVLARAEISPHFEAYLDDEITLGARFTTSFSDLRFTARPDKINFGAAAFSSNVFPRLPLTFKAGNLSAGGALSTLNSPELTTSSSPFTTSSSATPPLTATLPGYSSFSKPVSAFLEFATPGPSNQKLPSTPAALPWFLPFSLKLNTWFTQQASSPVVSFSSIFPCSNKQMSFSATYIGGIFYYNDNSSGSWFLKSPYYPAGQHFCGLLQLSADFKKSKKLPGLAVNLSALLYESPFGFFQTAYRAEAKVTTKRLQIFLQAFFNPYDQLLTSSGKSLFPSLQLKSGLIFKSPAKVASLYFEQPVFLRAGINFHSKINLTKPEHPLKANAGLQLSTDKASHSLSFSMEGNFLAKAPQALPDDFSLKNFSAQLKNCWKAGNFSPNLTAGLNLPTSSLSSKKYVLTAGTGFKPDSPKIPLTINATTTLTISPQPQDQSPQTKLSASLTLQLQTKYLKITGKLSLNEEL